MAFDLGIHSLHMSRKKYTRRIWVNLFNRKMDVTMVVDLLC